MIYLLSILVIVAATNCGAEKPTLILAPDLVAVMSEKAALCQVESNAEPSILKKILPWQIEESETNGKFLFCLIREMEFLYDDGRFDLDKFIDIFNDSIKSENTDEIKTLITECNKETGRNIYLTVYKISDCFHTKAPFMMSIH